MKPKISVIILVYKVEAYIEKCVRSLFAQTLDDIEYIFVNDATPDQSMDILYRVIEKFPQRKPQIKIINNRENRGQAYSRRKGIEASSGSYIIHCDSDDWADVTLYERLYNKARKEKCDIVWCDFFRVRGQVERIDKQSCQLDSVSAMKAILCGRKMGVLWNTLVKADIARRADIIYPDADIIEDVVLMMQYLYHSRGLGYVSKPLYYYFNHKSSSTMSDSGEVMVQQVKEMNENLKIIFSFLKEKDLDRNFRQEIVFRKFFNKRGLLPAIQSVRDCQLWMQEYPEINSFLFLNPYISVSEKIISLLVEIRIYPCLRKILRKR